VLAARINADQKRAILGGNAARVFGLPVQPLELAGPTVATGLVDVHGHFGALGLPIPVIGPQEHVADAARHGITLTIASSLTAIADDTRAGNAEAFAASSEALQAYVVVDPNDLAGSCKAMDDAYGSDRAVGAKLHCSYAHAPTATRPTVALLREVAKRGRPLLIHVEGPEWDTALLEVARAHPHWSVIVAHAGPGTAVLETACVIESSTNVYAELSTSSPDLPLVRELVRRIGARRLLFGTDAPLLDQAYALGLYVDAKGDFGATTRTAREVFGW
jgi:predicted TIM-barrel fold metal-dependent hydrolase